MNPNLKWVYGGYAVLGLLLWVTVAKMFGAVFGWVNFGDRALIGSQFTLSTLIGLAATAGTVYYALTAPKVQEVSLDIVAELKRVTWPERQETFAATIIVIVTVFIMSVVLGIFDFAWKLLTDLIYQ
ncbi:MAG: preprotein translocase subunit SecE [Deltaproteobacteria bacterium]|nr:preprotein translocase subunit SecE [Deltaproteobacteria bacterium]